MDYNSALSITPWDSISKVVPSPTLNLAGKGICATIESQLGDNSTVLIVGCGEGGEGISGFSSAFLNGNVIGIDVRATGFADLRGDIHQLPIPSDTVDSVICQSVLEHVPDYEAAFEELLRVLRPGGYLYVDIPFMQGYHALPTDYRRISIQELRNRFNHLEELDYGASKGPTSTLVWIFCEYLAYVLSGGNSMVRKIVSVGLRVLIFWVKYIDVILVRVYGDDPGVLTIPSAVYWFGQKPPVHD